MDTNREVPSMRCRLLLPLLSASLLLVPRAAPRAQLLGPLSLGVGGGVSLPTGQLDRSAQTGWHVLGTAALGTTMLPLGLRVDGAYARFAGEGASGVRVAGENQSVASATLNLTYRLPSWDNPFSPYVIAGIGGYRHTCAADACGSETRFGWNAGLGTRFVALRLHGFVESRYHAASRSTSRYVPVSIGLML